MTPSAHPFIIQWQDGCNTVPLQSQEQEVVAKNRTTWLKIGFDSHVHLMFSSCPAACEDLTNVGSVDYLDKSGILPSTRSNVGAF